MRRARTLGGVPFDDGSPLPVYILKRLACQKRFGLQVGLDGEERQFRAGFPANPTCDIVATLPARDDKHQPGEIRHRIRPMFAKKMLLGIEQHPIAGQLRPDLFAALGRAIILDDQASRR